MDVHKIKVNLGSGMFSTVSVVFTGMWYCHDNSIPFYIEWNHPSYEMIDDNGDIINLYDRYFYQEKYVDVSFTKTYENFTPYENKLNPYKYNHNNQSFDDNVYDNLFEPSEIIKHLKMFDSPFFNSLNQNYFGGQKVLGVHRRGTNYKQDNLYVEDEVFFDKINETFKHNSFDKIFIITDDVESLENFKKEYGDQLIHTDTKLSTDGASLEHQYDWDKTMIMNQCMRDVFYLSQTDFKIVPQSNVSLWALLLNLQKDSFKIVKYPNT